MHSLEAAASANTEGLFLDVRNAPISPRRSKDPIPYGALYVQSVDGAARDVFHRDARLFREFLPDNLVDHVAKVAAPGADDQRILGAREACDHRTEHNAGGEYFFDHSI
ncbi:hypothetical protein P0D88_21330 [Paraburkholderia sp. RL18-103-BIB-C]|uniref:hypothetical protein n=1 Tax=Paraburkholderia sp. RL18-103-BIB-C TaxID=3031637 RepID=UPI0038B74D7F